MKRERRGRWGWRRGGGGEGGGEGEDVIFGDLVGVSLIQLAWVGEGRWLGFGGWGG